jgi:hypothetical protein
MVLKQKGLLDTSNPLTYIYKNKLKKGSHHAVALCHHQFLFVLVKIISEQIWNSFYEKQNVF